MKKGRLAFCPAPEIEGIGTKIFGNRPEWFNGLMAYWLKMAIAEWLLGDMAH